MVAAALRAALDQRLPGINLLLHGGPGTGKTEFARALVKAADATGFLVDHEDDEGREATRSDRLASLRLTQCFAGERGRAVLVLDEAEDIFRSEYGHPLARVLGDRKESKAWTNQLLECNTHPVIWISNDTSYMDPAYLRRFTTSIEFPATPLSMRRRVASQALSSVGCTAETVESVARDPSSTPALLQAAATFAALAAQGGADVDAAVRAHLAQHARASGRHEPAQAATCTQRFDMRYLHVEGSAQPARILASLQEDPVAALVFSGPPGTGKTQFAADLSRQLDRSLVVRTASDINSMWYGQSEANVAAMFRDCDARAELLFLDEADVLLASREAGGHRADHAVTSEFLRWLETFPGTFICATNHAAELDAALMRRFAFRLHFKPMTTRQRHELFAERVLGWSPTHGDAVPPLPPHIERRLFSLDHLTPGDFANAGRRIRRLALEPEAWLDELEAEHAAKGDIVRSRIGFQ
jgi:SpoVK/Ycf46/Vps4 family AAA+-type ATPase